ncbi:MAG: hypothetical protein ACR2L2_14860 [Acidobacteriota bacterium]
MTKVLAFPFLLARSAFITVATVGGFIVAGATAAVLEEIERR